MEPWPLAALAGMGSFCAALIWWILKHLQSDLDYGREQLERAVSTAEDATTIAEKKAG